MNAFAKTVAAVAAGTAVAGLVWALPAILAPAPQAPAPAPWSPGIPAPDEAATRDLAARMVGMGLAEAYAAAAEIGVTVRIASEDGESFPLTMDYSVSRVSIDVLDGAVTAATVG